MDQDFRERIKNDRVYTCEKHFEAEDTEIFQSEKMTKKKPRFGAIPKLNMPKKRHESIKPSPRPGRSIVKEADEQPTVCYKTFADLCQRVKGLKCLEKWSVKELSGRLVLKKMVDPYLLPETEIIVDDSLGFTVKTFGCYLPEDHPVYLEHRRMVRDLPIWRLVKQLEEYKLCCGVNALELTSALFHHVIPTNEDSLQDWDQNQQFPHQGYWRSKGCWLKCEQPESLCPTCNEYLVCAENTSKVKKRHLSKPAHVKAPVSKTNPERIKVTLREQRLRRAELERQLCAMRTELLKSNIEVDHELSNNFTSILDQLHGQSHVTDLFNIRDHSIVLPFEVCRLASMSGVRKGMQLPSICLFSYQRTLFQSQHHLRQT